MAVTRAICRLSKENHLPRVFQNGRDVGSNKHFVFANAQRDTTGISQSGANQFVWMIAVHDNDGAGAFQMSEGVCRTAVSKEHCPFPENVQPFAR